MSKITLNKLIYLTTNNCKNISFVTFFLIVFQLNLFGQSNNILHNFSVNRFAPDFVNNDFIGPIQSIWLNVEICDNGIDDDGDNLVDEFDDDCNCTNDESIFNNCPYSCEYDPSSGSNGFDLIQDWVSDVEVTNISQLFVGDMDNDPDEVPEILSIKGMLYHASDTNAIYILNGVDGSLKYHPNTLRIHNRNKGLAVADTDKDGLSEFFYVTADDETTGNSRKIVCYEYNPNGSNPAGSGSGTFDLKWISNTQVNCGLASSDLFSAEDFTVSIADFNYDDHPEIYVGNEIYDAFTGQQIANGGSNSIGSWNNGIFSTAYHVMAVPVAVDVLSDLECANCSGLELVAGNQVYSVNIATGTMTVEKQAPNSYPDGNTAIADYDLDGDLDGIITSRDASQSFLYIWDLQTNTQIGGTHVVNSTSSLFYHPINLPIIADFDGDNRPEIGVCGNLVFQVIEDHLTDITGTGGVSWSITTTDNSGQTGASVFDFNGDGISEVVYRDEDSLRIISGPTGVNLATFPCGSGTGGEYSVIADIDNDGETEIICNCSDAAGDSNGLSKVNAFKSNLFPWVPTRKLWNQYAYFNVNINDDLTIPVQQQAHHLVGQPGIGTSGPLNIFLKQISPLDITGELLFPAADLTLSVQRLNPGCDFSAVELEVTITNNGDNIAPSGMPTSIYDGNPLSSNANFVTSFFTDKIVKKGNFIIDTVFIDLSSYSFPFDFHFVVNDNGSVQTPFSFVDDFPNTTIGECNYDNNHITATIYDCIEICDDNIDNDGDGDIDCADGLCTDEPIYLSHTISGCIDQDFRDIAELIITVTWPTTSPNDNINITVGNKTEVIDVAGGATSPQSLNFIVPADGTSNNQITADWKNAQECSTSITYNSPVPCSNDEIICDILYLCGLDKPYDGDAWDHGWIEYLDANNGSNTILPILTKDEAGMGTYDVMNQNTFVNVNLANYDLVIISATTEGHISNDLVNALKDFSGTVLLSNYLLQDDFGMSSSGGDVVWSTGAFTDNTTYETLYNFDNPTSWSGKLFTHGDQYANSIDFLWASAGNESNKQNGILYNYSPTDVLPGVSSSHGARVYLGYHFNGIYANSENNGFLPSPASSWFVPENHLTLKGKEYFDYALFLATESCNSEICDNEIDDDGDGDIDCIDIDCGQIINFGFNDGTDDWFLYNQSGNTSTWSLDKNSQFNDRTSAYIDITATSNGTDWHIQFGQDNLSIEKDKKYKVTFDAKAVANRNVRATIQLNQAPYTQYASQVFAITTTAQTYSYEFVASSSQLNNLQLLFNLGETTDNIWFDNIQFKELPSIAIEAVGSSVICGGESADLSAVANGLPNPITYQWQKSESDSTFVDIIGATSSTLNTGILNATTHYKVIATSSSLCSPITTSVTYKVTVKRESLPTLVTGPVTTCPGGSTTLTVNENIETGNLIDHSTWTVGTASVGDFKRIGANSENHRILGEDPWGNTTVVWEARPGAVSNADGGWNTSRIDIDNTKTYRFSVWVNRNEIGPNGRFYLGTRGYGSANGVRLLTSTSTTTNPYFYTSPTPPNFTEDEWYLVVGHVFPHDHTGTVKHTDSGIFTSNEGYVGPTTRDYKWRLETVESLHRSYLYYATDTEIRQRWVYPRMDIIDGTEPSIDELLKGFDVNGGLGENATWQWYENSCGGTSVGSGKSVTVTPSSTTTYYVRGEGDCGPSLCDSIVVTVTDTLKVAIDYNGNPCLDTNSKISAEATGGSGNFSYSWTGPNSYTSTQDTIDITDDGNYYVTVTDDDTGCLATTSGFIYEAYEPFVFTLNTTVCEGETVDLSVNSGSAVGFEWGANASNATTPSVTVTPSPPSTTYLVTVTNNVGCKTEASATINVTAKPVISLTGPNSICEGGTTTLSPTSGGIWVSSDNSVATVDNMGNVTGQNPGSATFSFKNNTTGCWSDESVPVTVTNNGTININGDNVTCIGETITLTPSVTGGTWSSNNTSIATVNSSGDVTAIASGNVIITYAPINAGCYNNATHPITINNSPTVSITGSTTICEGQTTSLAPNSGGTWVSGDVSIATVTNAGVVTGVSGGNVFFTFTSNDNCSKTTNSPVTVVGDVVTALNGPGSICVGETTNLTPTSGGIWISSNNSIASVNGAGVVTAKANGTATFTFYEATNGCASSNTLDVTVNDIPIPVYNGPSTICIGDTTYLQPSSGGSWVSDNNTVASINNNGMIIGLAPGNARFTFTYTLSGCASELSDPLTVNSKPTTNLSGQTDVCIGSSISISPSSGGSWTSNNPTIASITNTGVITGLSEGTASFYFTNSSTGCTSDNTGAIDVHKPTVVDYSGPDEICEGSTTNLTPSSGGTWVSNNTNIATVSASGLITAIAPGTTSFVFTDDDGICSSSPNTDFTVTPRPNVAIAGSNSICIGSITYMTPTSGGTWTSSNSSIATISNDGTVTGVANGTVTFTFTNSTTGCISDNSAPVTVYDKPIVNITGPEDICIGGSTTLTPNAGGSWSSSNVGVASITNGGVVTGHSIGSATFTYIENGSGCTSDASAPLQ